MKCFYHPEREAVAICRACGRGVCRACALETETGIACRPDCAEGLSEKRALHAGLADSLRSAKRLNILGSLFSIGMGVVFLYVSFLGFGLVYDLILLLGIGFIVYGVVAQLLNIIIFLVARRKRNRSRNTD